MVMKAGDVLVTVNGALVDRVQSGGPGNLNIKTEQIYELGNYLSVAQVRDTPDLSFGLESLDMSTDLEKLLTASGGGATSFDLSTSKPIDVVGAFKPGKTDANLFEVLKGVAVPNLYLESLSYKFGTGSTNSSVTGSLRTDAIYYTEGPPVVESVAGSGAGSQTHTLTYDAYPYAGDTVTGTRYILNLSVDGIRQVWGVDYTEGAPSAGSSGDAAGKSITLTMNKTIASTSTIRVVYASVPNSGASTPPFNYPQSSHAAVSSTKPAAVKGRDVEIYVGGVSLSSKWLSVQQVQLDYKVNLQADEELGNHSNVDFDYDVPTVSGQIDIKPRNVAELFSRLQQISGASTAKESIGALTSVALPLDIVIKDPVGGSIVKDLYVPDARFVLPGFSQRVQAKFSIQLKWDSDSGSCTVYKGARPSGPTA